MHVIVKVIFIFTLIYWPINGSSLNINRASTLKDTYRQSVVKITVTGQRPSGTRKEETGTGFIVANNDGFLFIVTANHVIGSSATAQAENRDWSVLDGQIERKISVSGFGLDGVWREIGEAQNIDFNTFQNIDIALLTIGGGPELPPMPLKRSTHWGETREIMLLGFRGKLQNFTSPIPIGYGERANFTDYNTDKPSRAGESGGPWIDIRSGNVIAVASRVDYSSAAPSNLAVPIDFVVTSFGPFLGEVHANLKFGDEAAQFAIASIDGSAVARVTGTSINGMEERSIGETVSLAMRGREQSDCNSDSGRTVSRGEVTAMITANDAQGLNFDYIIEAQGGHYRTSIAGCMGNNLIGIRGHDTTAQALLEMHGFIEFGAIGSQSITLDWKDMPANGASYRLTNTSGGIVTSGSILGSDSQAIEVPVSGNYILETNIIRNLSHVGISGARSESANPQISISPNI